MNKEKKSARMDTAHRERLAADVLINGGVVLTEQQQSARSTGASARMGHAIERLM